ncbi:MAG: ankyrin repeat domain-containing protein, partial [Puniceicoccales bacterium]|nr:ankyrin repeat domain-containing protein [Puniceicoccales bacterium]
ELIEAGADVNAKNNSNWTSLHHATHSGNWSMVQFLIDHHADVNAQTQDNGRSGNAPLHLAAKGRHLEDIAKYLIDNGANLNPRNETSGHRPIHDAVINGNLEMVKLLVDGGADMQPEDYSGWNRPLHHAAQRGFREIAKYMLDHGTDVNVKNHSNLTPLDVARDEEMKKFLRKYKGISGHPKATQPKSFWGSMRQWFKKSR